MKKQTENLKLNCPELEDFKELEDFINNNFEMQEKFITKLVLDYLSDVFVEYARLFKDNALEHQNKGHFHIIEANELVEMAEQATKNIKKNWLKELQK